MYPASYDSVISVTSVGYQDNHYDSIIGYHTHNDKVDICAPGYHVLSTFSGGGFGKSSGTSFAAPYVAGVCGLMFSVNPFLQPKDFEIIIKATADKIDTLPVNNPPLLIGLLGAGRINAFKALQVAQTYPVGNYIKVWGDTQVYKCTSISSYHVNVNPTLAYQFLWEVTNGSILSGQGTSQIVVSWDSLGIYNDSAIVKITVSHNNLVFTQDELPVKFVDLSEIKIAGDSLINACNFGSEIYSILVDFSLQLAFNWEITGGNILSGQGTKEVTVAWDTLNLISNIHKVKITSDCNSAIILKDSLDISFYGPDTLNFHLTGDSVLYNCPNYNSYYQWTFPNGNNYYFNWNIDGGIIKSDATQPFLAVEWDTSISVQKIITATIGCKGSSFYQKIIEPTTIDLSDVKITGDFVLNCCGSIFPSIRYELTGFPQGHFYLNWEVKNGNIIGQFIPGVQIKWTLPKKEHYINELTANLTMYNGKFCRSYSHEIYFCSPEKQEKYFKLYPNPVKNGCTLSYFLDDCQTGSLQLFNILGSKIIDKKLTTDIFDLDLDLSFIPNGLYFYRIIVDGNIIITDKLIVDHDSY